MAHLPNVCLYPQAQAMKRALSEIHLLATQKVRSFFQLFFMYAGVRLLTRALQV